MNLCMNSWYEFICEVLAKQCKPILILLILLVFHELIPNVIDVAIMLALFHGWMRSYSNSYLKHILKNIVKIHWRIQWFHGSFEKNLFEKNLFFSLEFMGASDWLGQPILPPTLQSHLPHYQLVCLAELQPDSANTCHLGLITHSFLAARAAITWIL